MKYGKAKARGKNILGYFKYGLLYILLLIYLCPFYLVVINSFKNRTEIISNPLGFISKMDFSNFVNAFRQMNYLDAFINSLIITSISVLIIALFSSMTAYFFVRFKWKINKFLFFMMVTSMLIPFQSIMIPLVRIYGANLKLLDNKWILIYMYMGFGSSLSVFVYHGFIKSIPMELEEAAMIDGCTRVQTFFKIVFPLLRPTTLTLIILNVLWIWNDFLLPSLVLISKANRTLPLSTFYFHGTYTADYGLLMAGLLLTIIPVVVFFILMQKHIISGIMQGAIK
jgi:raffinose/stachyose/melibiose transport system permease protein